MFNEGEHAATPPDLSARCLAELGRAGVSRGTAVVADAETVGGDRCDPSSLGVAIRGVGRVRG